jgi:soluble lytic murein transglycosylase
MRTLVSALTIWLVAGLLSGASPAAVQAQTQAPGGDETVLQAREALRRKDRNALAAARMAVNTARHPLAPWVEYWELGNRLAEAQQSELDAFYARWPGSYVEDRLRNDWLLELGRRRDWARLRAEHPRFRMNDDREVSCYALLAQYLDGQDVKVAARAAWAAQKELDDGCALLGKTLIDAKVLTHDDAWHVARAAVEANRPRTARAAVLLIQPRHAQAIADALDNPARFLARKSPLQAGAAFELTFLALMRLAAVDPDAAAALLDGSAVQPLPLSMAATAWAFVARGAAMKQQPQAADHARRAWQQWEAANKAGTPPPWSDDLLAWQVRAALRQSDTPPAAGAARWRLVAKAIDAMGSVEQRDSTWVYWRARATAALAAPGPEGDAARAASRQALEGISTQFNFYGKLALEDLGGRITLPPAPAPLTAAEREAARDNAGLTRALLLLAIGLRSEGVREWNFSLRGLPERELLAAAQRACEREVWDRCINTSDRTRNEIDVAQRFPLPFREQVLAQARAVGLDPAVLYGLMRQESRFVTDIRSSVGASGLMQIMPATAKWTAKQIGLAYRPEMINDRDTNLLLGASYLKRVQDDFGGSLALAAAAYNAGPGRPRRWREGGTLMEPAAWAESIPFTETRDYVKKVLSNSVYYAVLLAPTPANPGAPAPKLPTLKSRLGPVIGPLTGLPEAGAAAPDRDRATP